MDGEIALDVIRYIEALPASRQERLRALHSMILDIVPGAAVNMSYRTPTYTFGAGWVALANQKHQISLYTCGYHHIEVFAVTHPDVKTGKGCINLRDRDSIEDQMLSDLAGVVRHAFEHPMPAGDDQES